MKAYTDLEQSKKLTEILPIESVDMFFADLLVKDNHKYLVHILETYGYKTFKDAEVRKSKHLNFIPCWSLVALLNVLPNGSDVVKEEADTENERYMCTVGFKNDIIATFANNPVDACVEMIIKLHEQKLL